MADQRSRGGKKEGSQSPEHPDKHQGTTATTAQPEKENRETDRPRPSDPRGEQDRDRGE